MRSIVLGSAIVLGACAAGDAIDDPEAAVDSTDQGVAATGSGCADVLIITARASTERAGEGITGNLVTSIVNGSAQSVARASVSYPATLNNYAISVGQGISAARQQIINAVNACPNEKIVLLGYSQGAHVMSTMLDGGGSSGAGEASAAALPANVLSHIRAAAWFGNPTFQTADNFNRGTNTNRNGRFSRTAAQVQTLNAFGRVREWCDTNDTFCAGGNSVNVHLTYLNRYQNAATSFVLGLIGG